LDGGKWPELPDLVTNQRFDPRLKARSRTALEVRRPNKDWMTVANKG